MLNQTGSRIFSPYDLKSPRSNMLFWCFVLHQTSSDRPGPPRTPSPGLPRTHPDHSKLTGCSSSCVQATNQTALYQTVWWRPGKGNLFCIGVNNTISKVSRLGLDINIVKIFLQNKWHTCIISRTGIQPFTFLWSYFPFLVPCIPSNWSFILSSFSFTDLQAVCCRCWVLSHCVAFIWFHRHKNRKWLQTCLLITSCQCQLHMSLPGHFPRTNPDSHQHRPLLAMTSCSSFVLCPSPESLSCSMASELIFHPLLIGWCPPYY